MISTVFMVYTIDCAFKLEVYVRTMARQEVRLEAVDESRTGGMALVPSTRQSNANVLPVLRAHTAGLCIHIKIVFNFCFRPRGGFRLADRGTVEEKDFLLA